MSDQYALYAAKIDAMLEHPDLTPEALLTLVVARRLNRLSDAGFAEALGGKDGPPLNFWNKR